MPARKIGFLFLLLLTGLVIEAAWRISGAGFSPRFFHFLDDRFAGPSFTFEGEERQATTDALHEVAIVNAFGRVRVLTGGPGEVKVSLRKVVFADNEAEAQRVAERLKVEWRPEGEALRIGTNRREIDKDLPDVSFETHLTVNVPPGVRVRLTNEHGAVEGLGLVDLGVKNAHGDVQVEDIAGPATLANEHGQVRVRRVAGALEVNSRRGDVEVTDVTAAVKLVHEHGKLTVDRTGALTVSLRHGELRAHGVQGDVAVSGEHAAVEVGDVEGALGSVTSYRHTTVERVKGEVTLTGSHGALRARQVGGGLRAQTDYADVELEQIAGRVEATASHGAVRAQGLAMGARLKSSGGPIEVEGFKGELTAESERASISLVADGPLEAPLTARTRHGNVKLKLPSGGRFRLEASSRKGHVDVDLPGFEATATSEDRVSGRLGDGAFEVRLEADHGDVDVEKD